MSRTKFYSDSEEKSFSRMVAFRKAFTLTEILLAVAIVGIIAALVLPGMISKFNEKVFDLGFDREVKSIESAVNNLPISENKDFFSTMMYLTEEPKSYDTNSGLFIKKYLKVSQYCGDDSGNCFASNYYSYQYLKKEVYKPSYKGACAILKNGVSICITPQIGGTVISGIMDINGPKGPNVLNKDLRTFNLKLRTRIGKNNATSEVITAEDDPITPEEPEKNACEVDPNSLGCCQTKTIATRSDPCCIYDEFKNLDVCTYNLDVYMLYQINILPNKGGYVGGAALEFFPDKSNAWNGFVSDWYSGYVKDTLECSDGSKRPLNVSFEWRVKDKDIEYRNSNFPADSYKLDEYMILNPGCKGTSSASYSAGLSYKLGYYAYLPIKYRIMSVLEHRY